MRRKLVCRIAARLPQTIDASDRIASSSTSRPDSESKPNSRTAASSTPALITVDMKPVTGTVAAS